MSSILTKEEKNKISQNIKLVEFLQPLIAIHARKTLKISNQENFMQLINFYFQTKPSKFRYMIMEDLFKHLSARSEYNIGLKFFSDICKNLEGDSLYIEMGFALFFAYQLKKFDEVQNILILSFPRFQLIEYEYFKYYCMFLFYQGQIFLCLKVFYFIYL